jgi:hypothetical protein
VITTREARTLATDCGCTHKNGESEENVHSGQMIVIDELAYVDRAGVQVDEGRADHPLA